MRRLLLCLPLCFVVLPGNPHAGSSRKGPLKLPEVRDDGSTLPDNDAMTDLAEKDPMEFLRDCLRRYDRSVKGYRCVLRKQERLNGKLGGTEVINVAFREKPFSVLLDWKERANLAQRTLYVKGENSDQILVLPAGWRRIVGVVAVDPNSRQARESGRYPITEFGIKIGMQKALASWQEARKQKALHLEYLGERRIKEAGNRLCWGIRRTGYRKPEEDGITESTFWFDQEDWLMVGSVLKGSDNQLLGEYFFRDIKLNPDFPPDTFTRAALTR